ncbi:hypothetical protein [Geodermatophilus sp. SYSU D00684]
MTVRRWVRRVRHPAGSARRLVRRVAEGRGLPVGRTAGARRLLRAVLGRPGRALVLGGVGVVRQALPGTRLDVVGTDPHRPEVTVVSEAAEEGSLPRRWECVVVTEPAPSPGRLAAAVGATLPGGVLALVGSPSDRLPDLPGAAVERTLRRGSVRLVVARVAP